MAKYYMCEHCGRVYEEYEMPKDWECESCGYDVQDADKCELCGEIFIPDDFNSVCDKCLEKNVSIRTPFELFDDETENIAVHSFLAYVFSPSEIEDILMRELEKYEEQSNGGGTRYAYKYLMEEDKYAYSEALAYERKKKDQKR